MKKQFKITAVLVAILSAATLLFSCTKEAGDGANYLKLSHGVANISDNGSKTQFAVESDLRWNLKFSPAVVEWAEIDKTSGNGNSTVTITAMKPALPNGAVRSVDIIATAENNSSIPPIRLMLLQHDSTFKKY